jgi:hypothetical protein
MSIDFENFSVNAIKIIDELRSTNADPNNINSNSSEPVESRINTFYRAVGLPAFTTNKDIDRLNNGNFHETDPEDQTVKKYITEAIEREISFSKELTEEAQKAFLDNMEDSILSSLKKVNEGGRIKGGLFPMVVNGNIRVKPNKKRIGGAFFQKDSGLTHSGIIYRRPLIELIVLLRLRGQGFVDSTDKESLQSSFPELQSAGFFDGAGENLLTIQVLKSLLGVITDPEGLIKVIYSTVKNLGRVRKQIREFYKDSKSATVAEEQPRVGESVDNKGQLEKQKLERETIKSEGEARITFLEYDDTLGDTTITTKNMKNALFAPMVLDTLLSDTREVDKAIKEGEAKKENLDRVHKKMNKTMDLVLGTYSGISGIDVLVVITALFSIEEGVLLGLLNKESLERLAKLKSTTISELPEHVDVFNAVAALEAKTEEIFKILDELAEKTNLREKIIRNEG